MSPFITPSMLQALASERAANPAYDLARLQVRDQLAWLHERLYAEIRAQRWDLHYMEGWSLSPAQVSPAHSRIAAIQLRYSKAETSVRIMRRRFNVLALSWDDLATLGVRVDPRGISVELGLPALALLDARNLRDKLVSGAPEKRALRQIFAELGGDFSLSLSEGEDELMRVRCSRLADLRVLDPVLARFTPGAHDLAVGCVYAPDHPRLEGDKAVEEVIHRLTQLYVLYQFSVWSPRNNFLAPLTRERNDQESQFPTAEA